MAGARRWTWNWALARRISYYREHGAGIPCRMLSSELTALKRRPETAWLKQVDAQLLQQALIDLDRAFVNFFGKRGRFPNFKSKKRDLPRFRIPQRIQVQRGKVRIPKVGWIALRQFRDLDLPVKSATCKRDATGDWYVSLVTEFVLPDEPLRPADPEKVVGIDLGLIDFVVTSDRCRIPAPKFLRRSIRRVREAHRRHSRSQQGSRRRIRAHRHLARVHRRVANRRRDFIHKLTIALVRRYDGLCIETLNVRGLARTKLARSIYDAGFGEFARQVQYKALWHGKHFVKVATNFPSSQICGVCEFRYGQLERGDREWDCPVCNTHHLRDLNAANNIRREGMRLLNVAAGQTETLNARGLGLRPSIRAAENDARIPQCG